MSKAMRSIIYKKIREKDKITFADYMDTVLYHPEAGYYTTKQNILGKSADFYTSAHVGEILGQALAETYINEVVSIGRFNILEYGAGEGRIAAAFLAYLKENYNDVYKKCTFYIIEISENMRQLQRANLSGHKVRWISSIKEIAGFAGMIYGNEFLDALPVHIIKYFKDEPKEMYLSLNNQRIIKNYEKLSNAVQNYMHLLPSLPSQSVTEFSVSAIQWLEEVFQHCKASNIYLLDYGYTYREKKVFPFSKKSTIRCFKNHQVLANPFAQMGKRDITYDVDFTTIQKAATETGFVAKELIPQSRFILQSGLMEKLIKGRQEFQSDKDLEVKMRHLKQLVFPSAMGEVFKVQVLTKNI